MEAEGGLSDLIRVFDYSLKVWQSHFMKTGTAKIFFYIFLLLILLSLRKKIKLLYIALNEMGAALKTQSPNLSLPLGERTQCF